MPYSCINIILNENFKNGYNRNQSEKKKKVQRSNDATRWSKKKKEFKSNLRLLFEILAIFRDKNQASDS